MPCIKLNIQVSFFCLQECFRYNWNLHKAIHKDNKHAKITSDQPSKDYFLERAALSPVYKREGEGGVIRESCTMEMEPLHSSRHHEEWFC